MNGTHTADSAHPGLSGRRVPLHWHLGLIIGIVALTAMHACASDPVILFNGRDLQGWTPKIRGYEVGDNFGQTFRVADGLLQVRYDQYGGAFQERFGHLFYHREYSHYRIKAEYRFVGEQLPDGPGWAIRNSGLMLHGQPPDTMEKDQSFPVSIEVQLLGGGASDTRPTANLCTPGTNVVRMGKLHTPHCLNSTSPTFRGSDWVTVEVEVRGNESIRHYVNGMLVMEYQQPQLDPRDPDAQRRIAAGVPIQLDHGTISIQSESHPIDFRKIELIELSPTARN